MPGVKDRLRARVDRLRARRPLVDHLIRTQQHFSAVKGNLQSGAVTYFGFLSFFPILALAFFVVGYVARIFPDVKAALTDALEQVLPGLVGEGSNQISLANIQDSAGAVGLIGLFGVLYAGLGWLSAMREALLVMFEEPAAEQPSFVVGKLRDLTSLILIGVVLIVSIGVSAVVSRLSSEVLDRLGLALELAPILAAFSVVVGLAAGAVLFYSLFRLLARPHLPNRALWSGALVGALGFEVLKQLSTLLIATTKSQPAFQAFGIALILLVWINYFSRVVMYAAAWGHTAPAARAARVASAPELLVVGPSVGSLGADRPTAQTWPPGVLVAAGSVLGILLARLVRRRTP